MGHYTALQEDVEDGIFQSRLLAKAFNDLSNRKHQGRLSAILRREKRHDGSETIITDTVTRKSCIVDSRPRKSIKLHKIAGHMIKTRDSKMTRQERIDWAIDRIIWLVVMLSDKPVSYNIITVRDLQKIGRINFDPPPSNPTALKFSIHRCMPIIPWEGGTEGLGLIHYEDVVEAFVRIINGG